MKNYSKEKIVKRAETKKNEKIKKICQKRDEMISYNISSDLIDDWFEKELQKIEKEYNNKINDDKIYIRELNKQKKKEINNLIKSIEELEKRKFSKEYIENFSNTEYNRINAKYNKLAEKTKIKFID